MTLHRAGQADIIADHVQVAADGSMLTARFDLQGRSVQSYDLIVTNPNGSSVSTTGAFNVQSGGQPQLWVDIAGRDQVLAGVTNRVTLVCSNSGNVDATGILPVWFKGLPDDATWSLLTPLSGVPSAVSLLDTHARGRTTTGSDPRIGDMLPLVIPRIPPGGSISVDLNVSIPPHPPDPERCVTITTRIDTPWDPPNACECALAIPNLALSFANIQSNPDACFGDALDQLNAMARAGSGVGSMVDWEDAIAAALAICSSGSAPGDIDEGTRQALLATDAASACSPVPAAEQSKTICALDAIDPNDLIGPLGWGSPRYVSPSEPMHYGIFFENLASATAPAHQVVVTTHLDGAKFDLATFTLGVVQFGSTTVAVPPGLQSYATDIDLRPAKSLIVRLTEQFNAGTGNLTCTFVSIDPSTGLPPDDPFLGFLPPNVHPPEGDGSISFGVFPKGSLATGTALSTQAVITFDANPSISTPVWTNTVDSGRPMSHVTAQAQDSLAIALTWPGTDDGVGVRSYSVFVSRNGGAFTPWLEDMNTTAATFYADTLASYSFYSVAKDSVGNAESKSVADVVVQSVLDVPVVSRGELALLGMVPNPARSHLGIWLSLPDSRPARLDVYDVLGRRVHGEEVAHLGPGPHLIRISENLEPGVYFVRLVRDGRQITRRGVLLR